MSGERGTLIASGLIISIFMFIGVVFILVGRNATTQAQRAQQATMVTADSLIQQAIGSVVVVEARISQQNPTLIQQFVAYTVDEYQGTDSDGDPKWRSLGRETPPLILETASGRTQLANRDYQISEPTIIWQDRDSLVYNRWTGESTKRYHGFVVGDQVVALGTVIAGPEGPALQAETLAGGTHSSYIDEQQRSSQIFFWLGISFVVGPVVVTALIVIWLRRRRSAYT